MVAPGMSGQPALSGLRGLVEGALTGERGVGVAVQRAHPLDLVDLLLAGYRHDRASGHAEPAVTDLELPPGGQWYALGLDGDEPVLDPRPEKSPPAWLGKLLGLAHGQAPDLGQACCPGGALAPGGQPR